MKKILSSPMGKRTIFYRQAVTGSPHRGWSLRNLLLYPFVKMSYPFKKNESFIADKLIIGANPILNLLLLQRLAHDASVEHKCVSVGILRLQDADYWAYHALNKEAFWTDRGYQGVNEFVDHLISDIKWEYLSPVLIENDGFQIYYFKKDDTTGLSVFHLIQNKDAGTQGLFTDKLPTVMKTQNALKQTLSDNIHNKMADKLSTLTWANALQSSAESNEKSHILIAKDIFLTSLARNWLDIKTVQENGYSVFEHAFSHVSFGSARKIANDFLLLERQAAEDIDEAIFFNL